MVSQGRSGFHLLRKHTSMGSGFKFQNFAAEAKDISLEFSYF